MKSYWKMLHDAPGKNPIWAQKMIPVLIYWATIDNKPHYYSDLSKAVGHKTNQIGDVLGDIHNIFVELRKEKGFKDLPSLNGMIISQRTKLPSHGFDYVEPHYSQLSTEEKNKIVQKENERAMNYDKWDLVLDKLGLTPYKQPDNSEDKKKIRKGTFSKNCAEGPKHKALKEYIFEHPEAIGIKNVEYKKMEYILLSGDRLDVYFRLKNGTQIAVEIKSEISDEADILRGIFQCVKYKHILNAEQKIESLHNPYKSILVLGGEMPSEKTPIAIALRVKYYENIKPE